MRTALGLLAAAIVFAWPALAAPPADNEAVSQFSSGVAIQNNDARVTQMSAGVVISSIMGVSQMSAGIVLVPGTPSTGITIPMPLTRFR